MKEYIVPCDDDVSEFESMKGNTELIRCKDCKYKVSTAKYCYCLESSRYIDDDGFCKWAKRKEE